MNIINFSTPQNIVEFCEKSLDPEAMDELIREHQDIGLSDPALEENLRAGNYKAVLTSLWSERDRTRCLAWLESKADELHPVLMFELAIAKFGAYPTVDTINLVSVPLLRAAYFRVHQDSQCAKDVSVKNGDAAERMSMTYLQRLGVRTRALLGCPLEEVLERSQDIRIAAIKEKVLETARLSLSRDLPSPDWVGWHGMAVFIQGAPDMHLPEEYKQIRDAEANKAIQYME